MSETPNDLIAEYLSARDARDAATVRLEEIQSRLRKQMETDQRKSYRWDVDGIRHTLTWTQSHTTRIDEPGLRKALKAKVFDRYTKRVLDRKAMEAAMDAGEVDPVTVSKYVTLQPNLPHLNYRVRPAESEATEPTLTREEKGWRE